MQYHGAGPQFPKLKGTKGNKETRIQYKISFVAGHVRHGFVVAH
jgi:hypothetical protein